MSINNKPNEKSIFDSIGSIFTNKNNEFDKTQKLTYDIPAGKQECSSCSRFGYKHKGKSPLARSECGHFICFQCAEEHNESYMENTKESCSCCEDEAYEMAQIPTPEEIAYDTKN